VCTSRLKTEPKFICFYVRLYSPVNMVDNTIQQTTNKQTNYTSISIEATVFRSLQFLAVF